MTKGFQAQRNLIRLNAKVMAGLRNEDFDRVVKWALTQTQHEKLSRADKVENIVRMFSQEWGGRTLAIKEAVAHLALCYVEFTGMKGEGGQ